MTRLIDADELKEMGATCFARRNENGELEAIISIDNAPTVYPDMAQVLAYESGKASNERPTGEWIYTKYYNWNCSECGKNPTIGMGYVQNHKELFNFCPHCGAKMKGGAE